MRFGAFAYRLELGLPVGVATIFKLDPEVKAESITFTEGRKTKVALVLAASGGDLAASLQTIREIGDGPALAECIADAFPGGVLELNADDQMRMSLGLRTPGVQRALMAHDLSDGTLRYLCLVAALLTPRPPELLALNEPETSLHPQLLPTLGRLIARAGGRAQLFVTTHSRELAEEVARHTAVRTIPLVLVEGQTRIAGQRQGEDEPGDDG